MAQDDPEKRIADLEHQLADQKRGADLPPAPPPPPADAAPETGSASHKPARKWSLPTGIWTGIFLVAFGVASLLYAGYFSYEYWLGTPTTAKVGHCERGGLLPRLSQDPSLYCNGTWSIAGQSQNGPIRPAFWSNDGYNGRDTSLDVHVNDGIGYRLSKYFLYIWLVAPIFVVWGLVSLWRAWRRRNSDDAL
jgi:hypothetical protein